MSPIHPATGLEVNLPDPDDPIGQAILSASHTPAHAAIGALLAGGELEDVLRALYAQALEEGLALAVADLESGRRLLAWIDHHIWPGGVHPGRAEAMAEWQAVLR